jgi:catechol 2,3-dioxygenase-like lactoylglutathione lyase family enzyme
LPAIAERRPEEEAVAVLKQVSHVNVWVHDQDVALEFYTRKLGFEVREDVTLEQFGNYRWLTVGPVSQPDLQLILSLPGPPALEADDAERLMALVARGAVSGGGTVIFDSDDVRATYADLRARGVEFTQEPMERSYGIDAAFRDPSGNAFRIAQRATG